MRSPLGMGYLAASPCFLGERDNPRMVRKPYSVSRHVEIFLIGFTANRECVRVAITNLTSAVVKHPTTIASLPVDKFGTGQVLLRPVNTQDTAVTVEAHPLHCAPRVKPPVLSQLKNLAMSALTHKLRLPHVEDVSPSNKERTA